MMFTGSWRPLTFICTLSPVENCFAATILEAMTARKPVILTNAGYYFRGLSPPEVRLSDQAP